MSVTRRGLQTILSNGGPTTTKLTYPSDVPALSQIGKSVEGRPIQVLFHGIDQGMRVLVLAGIHGDEGEGILLAQRLDDELRVRAGGAQVALIQQANPDGVAMGTRTNAHGVDLNRNFPAENWTSRFGDPRFSPGSHPASEPETRALVSFIAEYRPARVISIHSTRGQECINYDGPALELATQMASRSGYQVAASLGYETPGSLGSFAGQDQELEAICLELPRGLNEDVSWRTHQASLLHASGADLE